MGGPDRVAFTEVLDSSPWGPEHWKLFAVVSLNYFLDGVIFAVAPLTAYILAPEISFYVFVANYLSLTSGAVLMGALADRVGRRKIFLAVIALEVASLALLYPFHASPLAFVALTSAMSFGVGGEFGAAYAALAELSPKRPRGRAIMMSTNFWNIGSAAIAWTALAAAEVAGDPGAQARILLASALGAAIVVGFARIWFPESLRWLVLRGRAEEARALVARFSGLQDLGGVSFELPPESGAGLSEALSKYRLRLAVLVVAVVAQYVTYGMVAYYLPYAPGFAFGAESAPLVVLAANLGASAGAFALLPLIDVGRRLSTLLSFLLGTATAALLAASHQLGILQAIYPAIFANAVFSEWAWASISALQSELFPTGVRASVVGILTGLTGVAGALALASAPLLEASGFLAWMVALWASGLAASAAWYLRGVESAKKGVEELL